MEAYLDNLATTPLDPRVLEEMTPLMEGVLGNPHSTAHGFGARASEALESARERIAACVRAKPSEVVLLPSATCANNLAVIGVATASRKRGGHVVVSAVEHPSVLESARELARIGFDVDLAPVGPDGVVDPGGLEGLLRDDTVLVSVMAVNNEVGAIQPIARIAGMLEARRTLLHCDAAQAAGKTRLSDVEGADMVTLSSHKAYGPVGGAALVLRTRRGRPAPVPRKILFGGGQEGGVWPGTANVVTATGFARALELAEEDLEADYARISELAGRLEAGLVEAFPGTVRNCDARVSVPHCLSLRFEGVSGETLMARLSSKGIGASFGSACHTGSSMPSHVLSAMGIGASDARKTLRFGIGRMTTPEEIDYVLGVVSELSDRIRPRGKAS